MDASSIYSVTKQHKDWPLLLHELPEKAQPTLLNVCGTLPPPDAFIVGIVGTRHPTPYGKDTAYEIAHILAQHNIVIASGMAIGIDTIAHTTALEIGTPTVAVLGSGLNENVIYPRQNLNLFHAIADSGGAVVSEYAHDQKPEPWTFPQRNRIIAGISKVVIVIEAGEKSGALITARFATEYGRDVATLPGSIFNSQSKGTNRLIQQGAIPITSTEDILEILGIEHHDFASHFEPATKEEAKIISALENENSIDEVIKNTGLKAHVVLALITDLEIRGIIKNIGSGMYRKL